MNLDKKSLTLIQPRDISDYVNRGSEKRTSAVRKLSAIRSFFAFCQDSGLTYRNPASKSLVKVTYDVFTHDEKENREREPFTPEEVEALLKVAGPFGEQLLGYHSMPDYASGTLPNSNGRPSKKVG
jgi:site-specific recombinase XerD